MASVYDIYDAFLSKMLEDEWLNWTDEERETDWRSLLDAAIPYFKFPRVSLEIDGDNFVDENVSNEEIQILATYMKCEWLNRTIMTWENVKPLYEERDFSQANLIDKFNSMLAAELKNAAKLEAKYYRTIKRQPYDYTRLATQI